MTGLKRQYGTAHTQAANALWTPSAMNGRLTTLASGAWLHHCIRTNCCHKKGTS